MNQADSWERQFEELRTHLAREGRYPTSRTTLGSWVGNQRVVFKQGSLGNDRRERLEGLPGWAWNGVDGRWQRQFEELSAHLAREGRYPTSRTTLGIWIINQRVTFKQGSLSNDRRERLEELPGWVWSVREDHWHQRYAELSAHLESEKGYPKRESVLGRWVVEQRTRRYAEQLEAAREVLLEELPGWTWDAFDDRWERRFEELSEYLGREGRYPTSRTTLGTWINNQKDAIKGGSVSPDRRARLEALPGWTENNLASRWENRFEELRAHLAREGRYPTRSTSLGIWIANQRVVFKQGSLSNDRRERLEGLPGWAWNGVDGRWQRQFEELSAHLAREGRYPTQGSSLGFWINHQRVVFKQGSLSNDRRERLEGLPGWAWNGVDGRWQRQFEELSAHLAREGRYPTHGSSLRSWINRQRVAFTRGSLSPDRRERLEGLAGWKWAGPFQRGNP
ncbi:helicase associated domain-containing protein [Mycolicibacterium sp. Y3]